MAAKPTRTVVREIRTLDHVRSRARISIRRAAWIAMSTFGLGVFTGLLATGTATGAGLGAAEPGEATAMALIVSAGLIATGIAIAFWRHLAEGLVAGSRPASAHPGSKAPHPPARDRNRT